MIGSNNAQAVRFRCCQRRIRRGLLPRRFARTQIRSRIKGLKASMAALQNFAWNRCRL
jgi:hypothetical protein